MLLGYRSDILSFTSISVKMRVHFLNIGVDLVLCLIIIITMLFGFTLSSDPKCQNTAPVIMQNPADGVCGDIHIRNKVSNFRKLENCTVIEGSLQITLIDNVKENDFENYSFPLLREITDFLVLYRVDGLKTMRHLFPNLAVIRGLKLFHNYALVAYEMFQLEELGLPNLRVIMRGAVRLTKNNKLCYIDTIDWSRIATGVDPSAHHFMQNKETSQCVNYCPDECPTTTVNEVTAKRCWTAKDCQKGLNCRSCKKNVSCMDNGKCCHEYCLGGCTGPGPNQCFACVGMVFDGACMQMCTTGTYMFANWRCLTDKECMNLSKRTDNFDGEKAMLLKAEKKGDVNQCVMSCPTGYTVATKGIPQCIKCQGFCPKECNSTDVNSIQDAERFKGCSKIIGSLIIQITGTNVVEEMEENLGDIREVTAFIKILSSAPLLNLHFFKSLEIIGGEKLTQQGHSLEVMDNVNLQELFPEENMKKMKIRKGKVSFHGNRELCKYKIDEFVSYLNLSETPTEKEISSLTNGDLKPCMKQELKLVIAVVLSTQAILKWERDKAGVRNLLTYMINYKEIKDKNVNIHQGRDACSEDIWTIREQYPTENAVDVEYGSLIKLKPYTMYAVYVQAYTLATATHSVMTNVETFITKPYYPSEPRHLKVFASSPSELHVSWKPPKHPNGNVTHYKVSYLKQTIEPAPFEQRNYCVEPVYTSKEKTADKEEEKEKITNVSYNCCACPKSNEELAEEARKQEIEVHFENYLQNNVYYKRFDKLPKDLSVGYSLDELANINFLQDGKNRHEEPNYKWIEEISAKIKLVPPKNESRYEEGPRIGIGSVEVFDLEVDITNLDPFVEYTIEVQACQDTNTDSHVNTKLCSHRAIAAGRTKAIAKLDMINESTIHYEMVTNKTGEVLIKWDPPPTPNGLILMYNLFYKRAQSNQQNIVPQQVCIRQSVFRLHNGYPLNGLEPGNWTFWINAVSLAGNSSETSEHFFIIASPMGEDSSNYIFIITIIIVIPVVIVIIIVTVWFVAKNKFRHDDLTVISQNVNYVPSDQMYIMDSWEVDRDKIRLVRELGQGSFGMVYEGTAIGLHDDPEEEIRVAVKTVVNNRANFNDTREFLQEATTMKAFDCYHVVKLLGVVSHGQPALVIMELMALGDLKIYLRGHRPDEDRPDIEPPRLVEILQMAGEIADGMAYLAANKFVHRDLAARNCMVDENKTVKIGDFGMTRDIYETDYYRKGGKGMLPVRWMAPESLRDGVFTTMSDVWSFGVVMWEMVTLAAQPYQGLSNEEVVKFISNGSTMEMPDNCPAEMVRLMQRCWARKPKHRPTFLEIIQYLLPKLNSHFSEVSYFFNEGGGPVEGGHPSNLEPPSNAGVEEENEVEDEDLEAGDEDNDFSDNVSSIEGASAPPLSDSSEEHKYPVDQFQVDFSYGKDQNGVLNKGEKDSFYQFNELPDKFNANARSDSNLDESFDGESFVSDGDDDSVNNDSSRSFLGGDLRSAPHSLSSMPPPSSSEVGGLPGPGVIELQPLISSNDKPFSNAPLSSPSPNSDQSKAVSAPKYPGYQRLPLGVDAYHHSPSNNSQPPSSLHQKHQPPSAYSLSHVRVDRPGSHHRPGNNAARPPPQPLGAPPSLPPSSSSSLSPMSSSSPPPPLLPATSAAPPSRPALRLPVLNQPPGGGGFRRVSLFNSGSRDGNTSTPRSNNPPLNQLPSSSGDAHNPSGTVNSVAGDGQGETNDSPLISHSSVSPPPSSPHGAGDNTSSDGSKDSSKNSDYSQMNGLSNGVVWHRTAPC